MNQRWVIVSVVAVVLLAGGLVIAQQHKSTGVTKESMAMAASVNQLLQEAAQQETNGQKLKAKETYARIVSDYPDYEKIEEIQDKVGRLSVAIIASNATTPQTVNYEVKSGDSLGKLARQYNTTKELIKKSNNLRSDVIRVGQTLRIWNAPFSIFVDKSQNILILKSGDETVKVYRASTGVNNSTPVGTFKLASKIPNPVWFRAGGEPVPPESPDNQLGSRWMGFDTNPHYGIHGTIKPEQIGEQATAGCVRLQNSDVEELFDLVPVGTPVNIQD